jgi:hypothetical protein
MNNRLFNNLVLISGFILLLILILLLEPIYNIFTKTSNQYIEKFSLNPNTLINDMPNNGGVNIINCEKYPFLCNVEKNNNNFYPYSYRNAGPLKRLDLISPRYRHSSEYKTQNNVKKRWVRDK